MTATSRCIEGLREKKRESISFFLAIHLLLVGDIFQWGDVAEKQDNTAVAGEAPWARRDGTDQSES